MQELDARVDLDKKEPAEVAKEYLHGDAAHPVSCARHLLGRRGPPEQVALHEAAAGRAQQRELVLGLDALGDDGELGGAADAQRRLDDPAVALAGRAGDEPAVELDARRAAGGRAASAME